MRVNALDDSGAASDHHAAVARPGGPKRHHVLVVDDDAAIGKHIAFHLGQHNFRVSRALDGAQARASIARDAPDVIVLDHYLPDTTGEELLELLRRDEATRAIPVIYLTIDGSHRRFRKSMTGGADDFLSKPFEVQELVEAVKAQLRKVYARMIPQDDTPRASRDEEIAGLAEKMRTVETRLAQACDDRSRTQAEMLALNETLDQRVAQQAAEQTRILERQNSALRAYGYALAHELRSPLSGILGFAGLLMEGHATELSAESVGMLERIATNGRRMNDFIEGLLAMATAERSQFTRAHVDLSAMARDVVADAAVWRGDLRIAPGLETRADPVLARIVLENLLSNALKYTSRNTLPAIEFDRCEINGEQLFFLRDNGAGFDMQDALRLFEPFQRLHSLDDYDGLGIGLATVQQIVERHQGRIWARSAPGEGATFFFSLTPSS